MNFEGFPKIPRLTRNCVVTEKIDGTNASILIVEGDCDPQFFPNEKYLIGKCPFWYKNDNGIEEEDCVGYVFAGSRTKFITPDNDNMGFAKWVESNLKDLGHLGSGHHFGEWWGAGIQRKYDLKEKRFSLFNTARWNNENKPACCHIVPILHTGLFDTGFIDGVLNLLKIRGSSAAPGFMKPEGIVIYHEASRSMFKKTIDKDDSYKGNNP